MKKRVVVEKIGTLVNGGDLLTKPLDRRRIDELLVLIGMVDGVPPEEGSSRHVSSVTRLCPDAVKAVLQAVGLFTDLRIADRGGSLD